MAAATAGTAHEETASGQAARWRLGEMVGRSTAMERLFLQMRYLASHLRIALIEGEPGTGKRLAAETLHTLGPLRGAPFIAAQAPVFLAPTEGRQQLAAAAGGTLYLAHVEAFAPEAQLRLLHLIEWVRGSSRAPRAAFAGLTAPRMLLVSAARPLRPLTLYGRFRGDLQQQLALVRLCLPPLRERIEDVPLLAEQFGRAVAAESGRPWAGLSREGLAQLAAHGWPGNVAQLRETVCAAAMRGVPVRLPAVELAPEQPTPLPAGSGRLHLAPAPGAAEIGVGSSSRFVEQKPDVFVPQTQSSYGVQAAAPGPAGVPRELNLDRVILLHIRWVLASVNGNKLRAARLLGISRSTLYRLLEGSSKTGAARTA